MNQQFLPAISQPVQQDLRGPTTMQPIHGRIDLPARALECVATTMCLHYPLSTVAVGTLLQSQQLVQSRRLGT